MIAENHDSTEVEIAHDIRIGPDRVGDCHDAYRERHSNRTWLG
jgi:hypothetical protein